jgi:hypothetical protein
MQLILNSARIACTNSNSTSRHISAAKPQAFVNEWRAATRFEALILTAATTTDADCNTGG